VPLEVEEVEPFAGLEEADWLAGAGLGWLDAAAGADSVFEVELAFEVEVDVFVFDFVSVAEEAPPLTVTRGVIFFIVVAEIPAFDKSSTEEYGRPAMIFFAVAGPTPGNSSNSFSLAVLRSTFALDCEEVVVLFDELVGFFVS